MFCRYQVSGQVAGRRKRCFAGAPGKVYLEMKCKKSGVSNRCALKLWILVFHLRARVCISALCDVAYLHHGLWPIGL